MIKEELLKEITHIFIEVLDDETIQLSDATTANEVDGWDSLSHIQLIVAIERHFNIRFTSKEIQGWQDVGEMVETIKQKVD